jgi:hypothetical protein
VAKDFSVTPAKPENSLPVAVALLCCTPMEYVPARKVKHLRLYPPPRTL